MSFFNGDKLICYCLVLFSYFILEIEMIFINRFEICFNSFLFNFLFTLMMFQCVSWSFEMSDCMGTDRIAQFWLCFIQV